MVPLALALLPGASVAAAQDPVEPSSAIYVSMCPDEPVDGRCQDMLGGRADTELTALAPDGSTRRILTDNDAYEQRPVWSPDGERVAFSLGRRGWGCDTNSGLRTMAAGGGDVEVLTRRDGYGCDFATDWSPNGRRILFEHECGLCFEVRWISADGEHDQRLSTEGNRNDPDAYALDAHWVNGGKGVVFSKNDYPRDSHGVFRVRPDTTGLRRISPRMFVQDVAVSPNGRLVAFQGTPVKKSPDRQTDVWVMRSDGSNLRQVTDDPTPEHRIQWSPDGTTLVFVWGNQATYVGTVRKDGSEYTALRPEGMHDEIFRQYDPFWSPDGAEIAFLGERFDDTGMHLEFAAYVVAADGSYYRRLTEFDQDLRVWGWEPGYP